MKKFNLLSVSLFNFLFFVAYLVLMISEVNNVNGSETEAGAGIVLALFIAISIFPIAITGVIFIIQLVLKLCKAPNQIRVVINYIEMVLALILWAFICVSFMMDSVPFLSLIIGAGVFAIYNIISLILMSINIARYGA